MGAIQRTHSVSVSISICAMELPASPPPLVLPNSFLEGSPNLWSWFGGGAQGERREGKVVLCKQRPLCWRNKFIGYSPASPSHTVKKKVTKIKSFLSNKIVLLRNWEGIFLNAKRGGVNKKGLNSNEMAASSSRDLIKWGWGWAEEKNGKDIWVDGRNWEVVLDWGVFMVMYRSAVDQLLTFHNACWTY